MQLFRRTRRRDSAVALYDIIVAQSRMPGFYLHCGVPDTVDGRFDMIALHAFIVLRRLKDRRRDTAQELLEAMFDDMDRSLREMGAGDLGVGRRVKTMATFGKQDTWYYIGERTETLAFFDSKLLERKILVIKFDRRGVVETVTHYDASAGKKVELVERVTPTKGKELGVLEQIIGNVGRFSNAQQER